MSNKEQLQENNETLERILSQLQEMPSTDDCMVLIKELQINKADKGDFRLGRSYCSTYTATDTFGKDNPNRLEFDFNPALVIVYGHNGKFAFFKHGESYTYSIDLYATYTYRLSVEWGENSLQWYTTNSEPDSSEQLNYSNYEYVYIVFEKERDE